MQSYQAQQAHSNLSEIPTTPSWEVDAARNRGLDLKKLRNENFAMGDALAASLRILQSEIEKSAQVQSASVLASLRTIEHVKDVLTAKKAHFDPKYADELVGAASEDLLQASKPAAVSTVPNAPTQYILDQSSPTLSATETLAAIGKSAFKYPIAPPRTPSAQAHTTGSYTDTPLPLAPAPTHRHRSGLSHASSTGSAFPDLGDWQSLIEPIAHPLSGTTVMQKIPPTSRVSRVQGALRQAGDSDTPLEPVSLRQGHPHTRQPGEESDPLGALY